MGVVALSDLVPGREAIEATVKGDAVSHSSNPGVSEIVFRSVASVLYSTKGEMLMTVC